MRYDCGLCGVEFKSHPIDQLGNCQDSGCQLCAICEEWAKDPNQGHWASLTRAVERVLNRPSGSILMDLSEDMKRWVLTCMIDDVKFRQPDQVCL